MKMLIQTWGRTQNLYRQAKAKQMKHHQTSFETNAKGNSLRKKRNKTQLETGKLQMERSLVKPNIQ